MGTTIKQMQKSIHENAKAHGWHDKESDDIPTKLLLIHSEVSEATEIARMPDFDPLAYHFETNGKPEGFRFELADIVIRVLDLAAKCGIELEHAIERKEEFNETRPIRHGGKRF